MQLLQKNLHFVFF